MRAPRAHIQPFHLPTRSACAFPGACHAHSGYPRRVQSERGFSLIEVCLAIGIVAFAMIPIIGIMPVGLNTFRNSIDASVGSQIVQRVIDDEQQMDFPSLVATSGSSSYRYFDTLGNEIIAGQQQPGNLPQVYTVQVTVTGTTTLPGTSSVPSPNLATVSIRIANNPGGQAAPSAAFASNSPLAVRSYCALVAGNPYVSQ